MHTPEQFRLAKLYILALVRIGVLPQEGCIDVIFVKTKGLAAS